MKPILISDAKCHDCSGPVTLFAVPDKVWRGLGLTTEWICMGCIARRINPTISAEQLDVELKKHRRRFNLKKFNKFCGEVLRVPNVMLMVGEAGADGATSITIDETMNG